MLYITTGVHGLWSILSMSYAVFISVLTEALYMRVSVFTFTYLLTVCDAVN